MKLSIGVTTVALAAASSVAAQETLPPAPLVSASPAKERKVKVDCTAFTQNPDGTWTPKRAVVVSGLRLATDAHIVGGVAMSGVDVGGMLNSQCLPR